MEGARHFEIFYTVLKKGQIYLSILYSLRILLEKSCTLHLHIFLKIILSIFINTYQVTNKYDKIFLIGICATRYYDNNNIKTNK